MRTGTRMWRPVVVSVLGTLLATVVLAVVGGQVDDFQDGTTQGWKEGAASPNPPTNVSDGGPAGAGDAFLHNVSTGGFGGGNAMVQFNQSQAWTGNFVAAGIAQIEMDLINLGTNPMSIRVGFQAGADSRYVSTTGFALPADAIWKHATFSIDAGGMTNVGGALDLASVLAAVNQSRIFHSDAPAWRGPGGIDATLGIDNITAVRAAGGSGRVPDGAGLAGEQLSVKLAAEMLSMKWGPSCADGDADYGIYAGDLGTPGSHLPLLCSTGGQTSIEMALPPGSLYFLVVPQGRQNEGSYGTDSSLSPRPASAAACAEQVVSCE